MNIYRILQASSFAAKAHLNQKRKDKITPYIYHPLTVSLILSKVTKNEDVLIAGILHDVVEDTEVKIEEIKALFGHNVATYVMDNGCI